MTDIDTKIALLRDEIDRRILPLIKSDYVLYALPYYANIGDTLIWEGTREMLKKSPHRCKGVCGWNDFPSAPPAPGTTILIMGGGFMGDIWRYGWENVVNGLRGCEDYPIVILPQSIWYDDPETMKRDAELLARYKNLTICVRDDQSFEIARKNFANPCLLAPDMAFHINTDKLHRQMLPPVSRRLLYQRRSDKELVATDPTFPNEWEITTGDWPTMAENLPWQQKNLRIEQRLRNIRHKNGRTRAIGMAGVNWLYLHRQRPAQIRCGVEFISPYEKLIVTRLHAMVLALLLGKSVRFIDNSYGKISALWRTWLSDLNSETVSPL